MFKRTGGVGELRTRVIRVAASYPAGSVQRRALLQVLAVRRNELSNLLDDAETEEAIRRVFNEAHAKEVLLPDHSSVWVVGDVVIEWDKGDTYTNVLEVGDYIENADLDALFPDDVERFNHDFWQHPPPLYHATTEDHADDILKDGLKPMSLSRGLTNRGTGAAVFTTQDPEETVQGSYGPVVFEIDMAAMKRGGHRPHVAQEGPYVEYEQKQRLAYLLGQHDMNFDLEYGISPSTVVVFGRILPEYLSRLD